MLKHASVIFLLFLLLNGCSSYNDKDYTPTFSGDIEDTESWYDDMKDEVLVMNVSIPVPNEFKCAPWDDHNATPRPCTLADINGDTDATDDYEPELHVILYTDNFNENGTEPNAVFKQKGKSTRNAAQKSYRIKLDSDDLLFRGERTFQLNKHPNDYSRVRNKLSFDFFREIEHITSLKTEFTNLFIDGVDYGLFTHVENVGDEYLANREWNKDDYLYKAQNFAFRYTDDLAIDSSGKPIDKDAFEAVIEPATGDNYVTLINMLTDINGETTDAEFETLFNKYFNRDNYITWMAINLVMANKDTVSQNFYLYNPIYSDTFYFLPWDYDGTGRATEKYAKWEYGIGTWWGIPLHNKFLKVKKNRDDLDAMVDFLRAEKVTPAKIQSKLDIYEPLITTLIHSYPDSDDLSAERWRTEFDVLIPRLDENIQNYKSQFGHPMPFWQTVTYADGVLTFGWEESVDFEGDAIVYDLLFADNAQFTNPIISEMSIDENTAGIKVESWGDIVYTKNITLTSGHYFMKVISKEKNNPTHYQISFDKEVEIDDVNYFGVLEYKVE